MAFQISGLDAITRLSQLARANSLYYNNSTSSVGGALVGDDAWDATSLLNDTAILHAAGRLDSNAILTASAPTESQGQSDAKGFAGAMLKAMDGVAAYQRRSTDLAQALVADPDSVDAHDVTIAMSEASLSLNITRSILDRVVRAWKEVISTR